MKDSDGKRIFERVRIIQKLLEDNFEDVKGPHVEESDGNVSLFYFVSDNGALGDRARMRVAFHIQFLGRQGNHIASFTLQALQQAKRALIVGNGESRDLGTVMVSDKGVRIGLNAIN